MKDRFGHTPWDDAMRGASDDTNGTIDPSVFEDIAALLDEHAEGIAQGTEHAGAKARADRGQE